MADKTPPKLLSSTPIANAAAVAIAKDIVLTFDEAVKAGTGNIVISDGINTQNVSINDKTQITFKDKTLTINPKTDLLANSHYSVMIDAAAIQDLAGNKYAGIKDTKKISFDTIDTAASVLVSSTPKANATAVKLNQDLTFTFNESIKLGSGFITISNGKSSQKISITDKTQVTFNDKSFTVNPKKDLLANSHYSITIDSTAVKDLVGNLKDFPMFGFDTVDTASPVLVLSTPIANATSVKVNQNFKFTFNESIKVGTGFINISNEKDSQKISITDKSQVTLSGTSFTVNPKKDLLANSHYSVTIDATAIQDKAGNKFSGITDLKKLSFDTVDNIKPLLDSTTPKNLADSIAVNKSIVLTFSEAVKVGSGSITIKSGKDFRTILVSDKSQVSIDDKSVTINPTNDFVAGATYTLTLNAGTFKDNANNAYAGNKLNPLTFKTQGIILPTKPNPDIISPSKDITPPNLVSLTPDDGSTKVAQNADFIIKFTESITTGRGYITVSDGAKDVRIINVESKDKQITIDNDQLIINPTLNLKADTAYFIKIDIGAIKDLAGNSFAGITDTKTFNFKTGAFQLITGTAIDDYIDGATVTIQDSDGKTYTTDTDNYGRFTFPKDTPVRSISVTGGIDTGTGNPFKGLLTAPAGASVVTPLTTLLDAFAKNGETLAQAQLLIAKAFGFDASKIDSMNYDQMAEATKNTNKESAFNLVAINAKIVNLLVTGSETLRNSSTNAISNIDASNLMVSSLVNSISKAKETKIDLNNTAFLKDVFVGATTVNKDIKFDTTKINLVDDVFATLIADTSANIDSALSNTAQNTVTLLSNVSRVSNFTQNTATNSIVIAISNPKTFNEKTLLDALTGSKADEAIKKTVIPDGNLTPPPIPTDIGSNTNNNTGNNSSTSTSTGGGATTTTTTTTPTTPVLTLSLASDTGSSSTDKITSSGQINVANLVGGRIWEYSINGGAKQTGSGSSISIIGDGTKSVVVTQTDAKNVEKTASLTFTLDTTPPAAPTVESKSGVVTDGTVKVTATESNWKYSVNGTESVGSGSSFPVTGDGNKSVLVWQTDQAGNDSSKASLNFVLSTGVLATPTLSLAADTGSSSTDNKTSNGQVNVFNLVSGTTWQYSLDGNNWITGSGSSFTVSGDGSKSVSVKQTNASGKVATSTPLTFDLDTSAPAKQPVLTLSSYITTSSDEKLAKSGNVNVANLESGATWQYSTDSGKSWVLGSGSNFTLTGDGTKSVLVKQTDTAGNSTLSESLIFKLDTTAPATPVLSLVEDTGNPTDNITGNGGVKFTNSETSALWYYSTDDNTWTPGNGSTFTITGDGSKSVFVKQIDIAGNESIHGRLNFTLTATKPSAPTLSLASDTGNPSDSITNNGQVNVFGLNSGSSWQYSIDNGTNWITGNGSNFSVSGDGTKTVLVKQIDSSGNSSTISTLGFSLVTSLPATPSIDSISSDGQVNISGLVSNGIWQYSVDGVSNVGSGSSFKITGNGTKSLLVKQTDGAGNVSADASLLNFAFVSGVYTGTPPNVAANLDSLEAQSITLSAIKLISSVKKTSLILTKSQLLNNQNALSRIDGTTFGATGSFQIELEIKSELTAKEMASLLPTVGAKIKSNSVTIKDSAQNVQIYWDQLHALNIDPPIGAIYFTDKVKPKLSLSLGQYDNEQLLSNTEQSGLLKFIKSPYSLVVYDVQTNDAITEALNTSISSVTITDTAAAISANFGSLINIYSIGKLNTIIVTDNKALDISSYKDLPKAADVLSKVSWLSSMSDFISDYKNSAISLITVKDSAESVQANIDLLQASIKKLLTIELTDNSIPTITLSEQQYKNDLSVLNKINTAHELTIIAGSPDAVSSVVLATTMQMSFNGIPSNLDLSGNTPITISYDVATTDEVLKVSHFGEDADKLLFKNFDGNTIEMLDTQINNQAATWLHSSSDNNHGIVLLGIQTANLVISDNLVTLI